MSELTVELSATHNLQNPLDFTSKMFANRVLKKISGQIIEALRVPILRKENEEFVICTLFNRHQ